MIQTRTNKRKIWLAFILAFLFGVLFLGGAGKEKVNVTAASSLKVHFIDVGQGDAALIQMGGVNTLIDTGTEKMYPQLKSYLKKINVTKIHNLIITHPDADHMGGADLVIKNYKVTKFYSNGYSNKTNEYKEMMAAVKAAKLKANVLKTGDKINVGSGATAKVLWPGTKKYSDSNDASVVIRLDYKKNSFLFTGDIPAKIENEIMSKQNINVDVLKVSHHGSDTSSAALFVKKASPTYSVISVGKNNNYGHPKKQVVNRLETYSKKVLRTDKSGTIVVTSTGTKLSYKTVKTTVSSSGTSSHTGSSNNHAAVTSGSIIGNKNTKKYHIKSCRFLPDAKNRIYFKTKAAAKKAGYQACKKCCA